MSSASSFPQTGRAETAEANGANVSEALSSARASLDANLRQRLDTNPWGVLGLALAAGYVAGGGLFTPLTARLLGLGVRVGLKVAVLPMVRQEIAGLAGAVRQGAAS
jgi:hypothetical protein